MIKIILLLIFSYSINAQSEFESTSLESRGIISNLNFYGITEFASVKSPETNEQTAGIALSVEGIYAFKKRWGVGGSFGGNSVYKNIDLNLTYAITGNLYRENQDVRIAGKQIANVESFGSGGFRAQVNAAQYYFNSATSNTISYSGMGSSFFYEHILSNGWIIIGGMRYKILQGGASKSLSFISLFSGINLRF